MNYKRLNFRICKDLFVGLTLHSGQLPNTARWNKGNPDQRDQRLEIFIHTDRGRVVIDVQR